MAYVITLMTRLLLSHKLYIVPFLAFGQCACHGDIHCTGYDQGRKIHYQGSCEYVMTRDLCDTLNATPTFEVNVKLWKRNRPTSRVTWAEKITFKIYNYVCTKRQNLSSGFQKKRDSNQSSQLQRLGRKLKICL